MAIVPIVPRKGSSMGYLHINNLYKDQTILLFKECFALEKVHGTSAHISWNEDKVGFFAGGESYDKFCALFDPFDLRERFVGLGHPKVMVFGEAYGGKQQGMSKTYGQNLHFIVFDVKIDEAWLSVPEAAVVADKLGLEFVPFELVSTDLAALDTQRDLPSRVAKRRGIVEDRPAEGVVLRPLQEFWDSRGRIIAKHKRSDFSERASKKDTVVVDPSKMEVLIQSEAIANEWVTPLRLEHVCDHLRAAAGRQLEMCDTPDVIRAMVEDVLREGAGEIVESKDARKAIGSLAAKLFKRFVSKGTK
jgi:hypothetical protein